MYRFGGFTAGAVRAFNFVLQVPVAMFFRELGRCTVRRPPHLRREFNWVVGVLLLVFTLLLSFTGYLLPWDQLAIWAITVGSNMARATPFLGYEGPGAQLLNVGGFDLITSGSDARFLLLGSRFVGEETLNRFYILHCIAIPLGVALLLAIHFWRVRKDGGISGPL